MTNYSLSSHSLHGRVAIITGAGKGECAIFDAKDITQGPICRIVLPGHIPMGAHACWAPQSALQVPAPA